MKKILSIILCFSMLLSFAACGKKSAEEEPVDPPYTEDPQPKEDPIPVNPNKVNPLTGVQDMDPKMEGFRPIGFSIGNTWDALPQCGIGTCDLLLEIEVEYGITRLMAFYADYNQAKRMGSVRSLRQQFLEVATGLDAMIVHMGAAASAYDLLSYFGYATLDGNTCYDDDSCFRDEKRLNDGYLYEHTAFSDVAHVENSMKKFDIRKSSENPGAFFNFAKEDEKVTPTGGSCSYANAQFTDWYDVELKYDSASGKYTLFQHGEQRIDENTGEAVKVTNAFIIEAVKDYYYPGNISPHYAYEYGGKAYYISNGAYQECTWKKASNTDFFTFYDAQGNELKVNQGNSYIGIINNGQDWSVYFE